MNDKKKKIEDFKRQAKAKNITRWNIHSCSGCGYNCGYIIKGDQVFYDNGCNCVWYPPTERTWEDLADHYNNNAGDPNIEERIKKYPLFAEVVKEMNEFWGFKD